VGIVDLGDRQSPDLQPLLDGTYSGGVKGLQVHWALPIAAIVVAFVIDAITFVVQ
jgi:hypothetical protein